MLSSKNELVKQFIKEDISNREIEYLVHFTPIKNLPSIVKEGILTVENLDEKEITYSYNDEKRLENYLNSISLSISFPNYSMFTKYRVYQNPKKMALLLIDPCVIMEKDCAYFYTNAASGCFKNIELGEKRSVEAWNEMFAEEFLERKRKDLDIPTNYTTHPQAEILLFDNIETGYIKGIVFENQTDYNTISSELPEIENFYYLDKNHYYSPRQDYALWK